MFEFEPRPSIEAIKRYVDEVKAARITLRTGEEIYQALIQEFAQPGSTKYASTYSIQNELDESSEKIWSRLKDNITSSLDDLNAKKHNYGVYYVLRGILDYQYRFPSFRDELQEEKETALRFSLESETHNQLYKMLLYAERIAPLYTWAHCNSTDTSTDVAIRNLTFPQDGCLYSSCFALMPETERALSLTQWAFATKNAESMEVVAKQMAYHLNAFILPDEGETIRPIPVSEHK